MRKIRGPHQKRPDLEVEGLEADSDDTDEPEIAKKQRRAQVPAIDNVKAAFEYIDDSESNSGWIVPLVFNLSYKNIYNLCNTNILANISIAFQIFLYASQIFL